MPFIRCAAPSSSPAFNYISMHQSHGSSLFISVVFFLVLQFTCAFKFNVPPPVVVPGQTPLITWTSAPSDPKTMNLNLSCNDGPSKEIASSITIASAIFPLSARTYNLRPPLVCNLEALKTDDVTVLDEVTIDVISSAVATSLTKTISTASNVPSAKSSSSSNQGTSTTSRSTRISVPLSKTQISSSAPSDESHPPPNRVFTSEPTSQTATAPLTITSRTTQMSVSPSPINPTTDVSFPAPSDESPVLTTSSTSHNTASTSEPPHTTRPIGAIVGGVVGGFVGLTMLAILSIIFFRRRRRLSVSPLTPLPYDKDYVQPLDKKSRLAQITDEKEAAQRQRDQLQAEMDHDGPSSSSDTPPGSIFSERQTEVLQQRILDLETQQLDLEHQLYGERPPPTYSSSNLPSVL
ncbi:hypothetical protein J132_06803 [Termitomyces sp. J132]|nr:hypothetical protein J132_06803 [Termitomyces sp. J132]